MARNLTPPASRPPMSALPPTARETYPVRLEMNKVEEVLMGEGPMTRLQARLLLKALNDAGYYLQRRQRLP